MNLSWLDALAHQDVVVLGSIVGSVVLAFVLIVLVFSLKLKSLFDRIRILQGTIENQADEVASQQERRMELARYVEDYERITQHYQSTEAHLTQARIALRDERDKALETARKLRAEIQELQDKHGEQAAAIHALEHELASAKEEIHTVRKRNEFWVDQLAKVRKKNETLSRELRTLSGAGA